MATNVFPDILPQVLHGSDQWSLSTVWRLILREPVCRGHAFKHERDSTQGLSRHFGLAALAIVSSSVDSP